MHDVPDLGWFDLSTRQRSIWLDLQTSGSYVNFQAGVYAEVHEALDGALLRTAVQDVMNRHDALRLHIDHRQPRQRVDAMARPPVEFLDLSTEAKPREAALAFIRDLFTQPFRIDRGQLFALYVIRLAETHYYCLLRMHHIALDAIALTNLLKDIAETYDAMAAGAEDPRPTSSYRPFQAADAAYCRSPRFQRDLAYWQQRLVDVPPGQFARRSAADAGGGRPGVVTVEVDADDYARFLTRCGEAKLRVGNVLIALKSVLLASASGQTDIMLGVAVPGRSKDTRSTIGLFSSVLPFRVEVKPDETLGMLTQRVTELVGRDYLHHRAPIDDICRSIGLVQRKRQNVFDVMLSYMPLEVIDFDVKFMSDTLRPTPIRGPDANPLAIYASEMNRGRPMTLEFAFNHDYLEPAEAEQLSQALRRMLADFAADPEKPISSLAPQFKPRAAVEEEALRDEPTPERAPDNRHYRVLSGFTADPVVAPLKFWLGKLGLLGKVSLADYNQVFQELLDPSSATRRNRQGANIVLLRPEDWLRERPIKVDEEADSEQDLTFLSQVASEFLEALEKAAATASVPYVVAICAPSPGWDVGGERGDVQVELLALLQEGVGAINGAHLIRYDECRALYPVETEYDAASDKLGHLPFTTEAFVALATMIARRVHVTLRPPVKVIAVDCDNTLWGGVIAEDGVDGIRFDAGHLALQRRLVAAAEAGVLICLVSKNIDADVISAFEQRQDMLLKLDHIVAHRINWQPKSENLLSLANELNLGADSFVMLDDNPIEIAEIEANCPQVQAILCASEAGTPVLSYEHLWPLDVQVATSEDRQRVERYRQNAQRSRALATATDYRGFIDSLGLKIRIERPIDADLARLAQLTERTNQFNINGQRFSIAEINAKRRAADNAVFSIFVEDKFGDYGLVGLMAAHRDQDDLTVDALLMSCRVLGRGVEHRMIAELGRLASAMGLKTVRVPVRITARNQPVREFLASVVAAVRDADGELYVLNPADASGCTFHPDMTAAVDQHDQPQAMSALLSVRHASGADWAELAGRLSRVRAIEDVVREATFSQRFVVSSSDRLPETPTEKVLAAMLREALGIERIGADDDFFDLGLHSLLAVQLVSRLRETLGVQLPVRTLFEAATVAKLAAEIDSDTRGSSYQPLVPLQIGDGKAPLFCCHPGNGDAVGYMRLANALGPEQTVYGFEASGLAPGEPMAVSLEQMARVYVKAMIAAYPSGPYNMIGWSFGGGLAFEMARQIEEAGREVGVLAFMDSVAPGTEGTHEGEVEMTDDVLLGGLTEQINVLGHHFNVPVARKAAGEQLTWGEVMENFQRFGVVPKGYTPEDMQRKMAVFSNCVLLFSRYTPGVVKAPILHFRALEKLGQWNYNWGPFTMTGVYNVRIHCNHFLMGFEPHVNKVAKHLAPALRGEMPKASWYVAGSGGLAGPHPVAESEAA